MLRFCVKNYTKHICILSDCFVPKKNSAAGMIFNLARSLTDDGYKITCVFGGDILAKKKPLNKIYNLNGINLIYSNFLINLRNGSNIQRLIYEFVLSITLALKCISHPKIVNIDMVVWYGPSAFLWFPAYVLKKKHKVPVYYILRDIFPDWLKSINIIKSNLIFKLLNFITFPQYIIPNLIGLETKRNVIYIKNKIGEKKKVEVLQNWNSLSFFNKPTMLNQNLKNFKRNILHLKFVKNNFNVVYTGNMSVAHDINSMFEFFLDCKVNKGLLYNFNLNIFGTFDKKHKKNIVHTENNFQVKYWDMVPDYNLPYIYSLVKFGLITLNNKLVTENIPGKFVSYTQFGLVIICFTNSNSAMAKLVKKYNCGIVIDLNKKRETNVKKLNKFLIKSYEDINLYSKNSKTLFEENFDIKITKMKLLRSFNKINK